MTTQSTKTSAPVGMSATAALWGGIAFSVLFTGLIWLVGGRLEAQPLLPDVGVAWYYWRLPEPTFWSRATAWGGYLAHQLVNFWLIYYAQARGLKYTDRLHPVNYWALAANAGFIVLHLIQTHIWYDGLAQDMSIFSSQGSVILLLVWVLLMENPRRGLFWGKKVPLGKQVISWARKYHGYVFSWAIVYTFWYHPMAATQGHLIGFFYMFFLMVQSSLFFTRVHVNRWWTFFQEFLVLVHGALVAWQQASGAWPMFAFGFAGILVLTQIHGLGLSLWARLGILGLFVTGVLAVYNGRWGDLNEIIRIPLIEYLLVFVLAGLIWLGLWLYRLFKAPPQPAVPVPET
jgi:hypothetical protein